MNNIRIISIGVFIDGVEYEDIYMGRGDTIKGMEKASNVNGIDFGIAMSKEIEVGIHDPLHKLNSGVRGSKLRVEYRVMNDNTQNTIFNEFRIYDSYRRGNSYTVLAQDKMVLAEENLSKIINKKKATVGEYINAIVRRIGCTGYDLKQNLKDTTINIEPSKYSARGFIGEVAALNGGFARITRNDKLEFLNIKEQYNKAIDKNLSKLIKTDEVDEPITINGLVYAQEIDHGKAPALVLPFNNILEGLANKEDIVENIYNQVKGITYTPVSGELYYIPFLEAGDFFKANSYNGNYITVASDIEYELGGLITFRNSGMAITDNLAINGRVPEEPKEPEEPEEPTDPELPDFKLEITGYRKPGKTLYLKKGVVNKNDDIWVRVDVVDLFKFIPDNYNKDTYKAPGTEGYITEEGEYGEGSYSLIAAIGNVDFYERYITPNYSLNITKDLENIDKNKLKDNIANFDKYFKVDGDAIWVKAIVENEESRDKLIIPSSFTYNIGLKNNNYVDERYDDEYYHGEGKLCLVDHNNLAWYGLDDVIQTYEMDKHVMDHTSIVYIDEDDNRERIPDVREIGMYGDLKDKLVENSIGGVQHNGIKKELYSIMVDEVEYVDLRNINSFPQELKKREYLYSEHDKGDYLKMVYFNIGHEVITTDRWYRSRFSISPRGFNIRENLYKAMGDWDWEWNFYRKGYLYDEYGGYDSSHYHPEIWVLMKPHPDTTREYVESFFYTIDNKDYETTYTKEILTEIILNDIKNKGKLTKEITFKPFVDDEKNKIYYKRRLIWGRASDPIWKTGECDIPKYSEFDIYKEYGKEKVCTMYIRQEDIEREKDETREEFVERVRGEYGEMYAMEVKDRENKNIHIPINQYLTDYSGWPDYEYLPFNYEADAPTIFPRMAAANMSMQPKIKYNEDTNMSISRKVKDKYYCVLNSGKSGDLLELSLVNSLNKSLDIYCLKEDDSIDKYTSVVSDINEASFVLDNIKYNKIIVVGEYAFDISQTTIYSGDEQSSHLYIDDNDNVSIYKISEYL